MGSFNKNLYMEVREICGLLLVESVTFFLILLLEDIADYCYIFRWLNSVTDSDGPELKG